MIEFPAVNPYLLVQAGPQAGTRFDLSPGQNTIGRAAGNAVVLTDTTVSRHHALVTVVNGVATLQDVGSSGGTFVNDVRLAGSAVLKVGDTVRIGSALLSFQPGASVTPMGVTGTLPDRGGRREIGATERILPTAGPMLSTSSSGSGCLPDLSQMLSDLQGCLGPLLKWLVIAGVVLVLLAIVFGIIFSLGMLGHAAGSMAGAAGATAGSGGSGDSGGSGGSGGAAAASPQQQNHRSAQGAVKIVSVKTGYFAREGYVTAVPVALVTWQNIGSTGVTEVLADVTAFDSSGKKIGLMQNVRVYAGAEVAPGATHSDDSAHDGLILTLDQGPDGRPARVDHATVSPTSITVETTGSPDQE